MKTAKGMKQKKLNLKPGQNKRRRPQKRKANDSGGKDQKPKFRKVIKTDQSLKSIMSTMATDEQTNQDLVLALVAFNSQPPVPGNNVLVLVLSACSVQPSSNSLVVRTSDPNVVTPTNVPINPPAQATIHAVAQIYPETNVKLQSILKK